MYALLKSLMIEVLLLDVDDARLDASRDEAGLDSLAVVELSMVLGRHHGIEISDDELLELDTVAEIVALMELRRPAAAA